MSIDSPRSTRKFSWFKLNRQLHRDFGYFCIGMTLVFAISGIAVNHIDDWNPNYQVSQEQFFLPGIANHKNSQQLASYLIKTLKIKAQLKAEFWQNENHYKLFFDNDSNLSVDFISQNAVLEKIEPRIVFKAINSLHLNELKQGWVYFSDLFAALLIFLALSSLFMIKGRNGVWGKRGLIVIAGFLLPTTFIVFSAN